MRSYNDYRNQPTDWQATIFNAARAGDKMYFQTIPLSEAAQALQLRDARGYSPFMLACYHGHTDLVRLLLNWGADPNDKDLGGNTVLMGAAFKGHLEIIKLLLENGADADQKNDKGQSAPTFAQLFGRYEALTLLEPSAKTNLKEKLKAWISFLKPSSHNQRNHHV